jgi:hypothetical protein
MANRIDLNTAGEKMLTQLPGVNITIARAIVNHRQRHGWFTAWEELQGVKSFPMDRLEDLKQRAILSCPEDRPGQTLSACTPPRHLNPEKMSRGNVGGYRRKLRTSRRTEKRQQDHPRAA